VQILYWEWGERGSCEGPAQGKAPATARHQPGCLKKQTAGRVVLVKQGRSYLASAVYWTASTAARAFDAMSGGKTV